MEEFLRDLTLAFFAVLHSMATIELNGRSLGFQPPYFPWFSVEQIVSTKENLDSALQKLWEGESVRAVVEGISLFPGAEIGPEEFEKIMKPVAECIRLWARSEFGLGAEIKEYFRARWGNLHY